MNLKAQAGFDGYCKENQWLPIHVEVENTGSDLTAEVQASYKKGSGGKALTSMQVELPATSRKEFFLYIYFPGGGYNWQLNVALLANGKVLKEVKLSSNCSSADNMIFGVLAGDPSAFDILNDVKPLRGTIRLAQLEVSDLPDRAQAWGALDVLIMSNIDTGTFTPQQKQALKSWIAAGGKLLVTGGTNWQSTTAGLQDLLPVDLTATSRVDSLSQLQAYVKDQTALEQEVTLAKGQIQPGAQVLVQQDGTPLIVQKSIGSGTVYFFAADPALQPLSNWNGMKNVYEHLLGSKIQQPSWTSGQWYDYRANQALATIPELGLPSIFYICGLLALYIVIIGPLNYFVLRRVKRRELAWVTIPVLVIIFTAFSYGTGFSYRGVTPTINRLAVAQAWDGVEQAQVRALVGVYSPVRAKYDLEASDGFVFQPFQDSEMSLQADNNWATLQQGSSMVMPQVPLEIGDMESVTAVGSIPALEFSHDLVIKLSRSYPTMSGTITNKSKYTIKDAVLITPGNWVRLGTIAPGKTKTANVSLMSGPDGPEFYTLDSMQVLQLDYTDIETDEVAARRSAFFDTVVFRGYGVSQGNWGIYLMGWVDQVELPVGLQDQNSKAIDTVLYMHRLSPAVKIEPGQVELPTSLLAWESSDVNTSPYYTVSLPIGGYTLRFRPAVPVPFRTVKSMDLHLTNNGLLQNLYASAWDYELQKWVRIPLTGEHTNVVEPGRYVGPDGEVKIRVVSNQGDIGQVTASNITLVVEP